MANEVFAIMRNEQGPFEVTSIGSFNGPPGGDAWQLVAKLDKSLLETNRHYVFIVSGKLGNFSWTGSTPNRGICQVCLGDSSGLKHPEYRAQAFITEALGDRQTLPFFFMVIFSSSPAISDPLWGATWPNTEDLCVYARIYRGGDPANWSGRFELYDLNFQAWDLDVMASTEHLVEEHYPARPPAGNPTLNNLFGAGWKNHFLTANTPGQTGEKWLHFVSLWTESRGNGAGPARFQHGYVTDGSFGTFQPTLGSSGKWGIHTKGVNGIGQLQNPMEQMGGFFPLDQPAGSQFLVGFRGEDWHAQTNRETLVYRWRYFGVKIEVLPDVEDQSTSPLDLSVNISNFGQAFWSHNLPAIGSVSGPFYFTHGILSAATRARRSQGWISGLATGQLVFQAEGFDQSADEREGVPVMAFSQHKLGFTAPAREMRNHFIRIQGEPAPVLLPVVDLHAIQFHPIKDPTRSPPSKPTEPAPVVIVPDREALDVASLNAIPVAPSGATEETPELRTESIKGGTGYRRTWGRLVGPRRPFRLQWDGLSTADKDSLASFFRTNITFKWQPPKEGAEIALALTERPAAPSVDPTGIWSFSVSCVELVFTGP